MTGAHASNGERRDVLSDVLLANSRVEEAWSAWVADLLRDSGRSVTMLQDGLRDFLDVRQVIERETRAAGQVVVLLSKTGAGFLAEVVSTANRLGRRVLPVHVDDRPTPYPRELAHLPAVDLTGLPFDAAGERLLAALEGGFARRILPNRARHRPPAPRPFVGRGRELERLRTAFLGRPAVVIAGVEGIGKSALAAHFIRTNRTRWAHVLWSGPGRFAEDQLKAITRPRGPALLVIDGAPDYRSIQDALWPVLLDRDLVHVLVTSRSAAWPDPLRVIELGPLDAASAEGLAGSVPDLAAAPEELRRRLGATPGAVAALADGPGGPDLVTELAGVWEVARSVATGEHGFYYLDTTDPAVIGAFERAFLEVGGEVELLSAGRRPWRRWWRTRCGTECAADHEVGVNAVARLFAVMRPVPEVVVNVGSTVFVKASGRLGSRIVSRTLSAAGLRRFEQSQRLREDPVAEALGEPLAERTR